MDLLKSLDQSVRFQNTPVLFSIANKQNSVVFTPILVLFPLPLYRVIMLYVASFGF